VGLELAIRDGKIESRPDARSRLSQFHLGETRPTRRRSFTPESGSQRRTPRGRAGQLDRQAVDVDRYSTRVELLAIPVVAVIFGIGALVMFAAVEGPWAWIVVGSVC